MTHTADRIRRALLGLTTRPYGGPEKTSRRPGRGRKTRSPGRAGHTVLRLHMRLQQGLQEAARRPDRGDISITTVIIWVAAVTGALLIAGTIAVVISKYNNQLNGL